LVAVLVRSDRRYRFAVPPRELWAVATAVDHYRAWWPWLRRFEADGFETGAVWRCVVQPPLPYTLTFEISLDEVFAPSRVRATIRGDIEGVAELEVRPVGTGSEARLVSQLAPANAMLRTAARLARPAVRFGHDWVLDVGARQFRARAMPALRS
jgi:uncharacterized protein YndB with AHSA1/START domain